MRELFRILKEYRRMTSQGSTGLSGWILLLMVKQSVDLNIFA